MDDQCANGNWGNFYNTEKRDDSLVRGVETVLALIHEGEESVANSLPLRIFAHAIQFSAYLGAHSVISEWAKRWLNHIGNSESDLTVYENWPCLLYIARELQDQATFARVARKLVLSLEADETGNLIMCDKDAFPNSYITATMAPIMRKSHIIYRGTRA